jgi:hypothetical protein
VYPMPVSAFLKTQAPSTTTYHLVDECRSAINISLLHQDMSVCNPYRVQSLDLHPSSIDSSLDKLGFLQEGTRCTENRSQASEDDQKTIPASIASKSVASKSLPLQRHVPEKCLAERSSNQTSKSSADTQQAVCHHGIHVPKATALTPLGRLAYDGRPDRWPAPRKQPISDTIDIHQRQRRGKTPENKHRHC